MSTHSMLCIQYSHTLSHINPILPLKNRSGRFQSSPPHRAVGALSISFLRMYSISISTHNEGAIFKFNDNTG